LLPSSDREQHDLFRVLKRYKDIPDMDVARRYRYGDLRLNRINFYNMVFRWELHYHVTYTHYGAYFGRPAELLLFLFGAVSVVLSAMQVALAGLVAVKDERWRKFALSARWFSAGSISVGVGALGLLILIFAFMTIHEAQCALRKLIARKNNRVRKW